MTTTVDTIYAVATGPGKAAIAIIRISGPQCRNIVRQLCNRNDWTERLATYSAIKCADGLVIDKAIVLFFNSPRSFTGEDMVELQISGGRGIKAAVLRTLATFPCTRPAEAGEFARRAYESGKLDLTEVEGLAAIIDAETIAAVRHSAIMAFGALSQACEKVRGLLLKAASAMEGLLDFSDIEDPECASVASVRLLLLEAREQLISLRGKGCVTERLREGFAVAVVGEPNVGKSTLVNFILNRNAVIVSEMPGTTRDYIEFFVDLSGFPVVFIDTAGFRSTDDPIERLGIERSQERVRAADLIVWLSDQPHGVGSFLPKDVPIIKARSKCDLNEVRSRLGKEIEISAHTGLGVDVLVQEIIKHATEFFADASSAGLGTERQRAAVELALAHLNNALEGPHDFGELIAEEIRGALNAVGRLTGRVDVEQVLEEVFGRLCVGK